MATQNPIMIIGNAMMTLLLRSPLHKLASGSTMLVTVKGRKSGKTYVIPVNYVQMEQEIYAISERSRTWWRNLRGGGKATLRLKGQDIPAQAEVIDDLPGVTAKLAVYLARIPQYARYLGVSFDASGGINLEQTAQAAKGKVVILFKLR